MLFKYFAATVLLAAVPANTTLHPSNVSFRDALGACSGALGSVSFSLGHSRVAAAPGIETDESEPNSNGKVNVVLQNVGGTKSARVTIDQKNRTVSAKNVRSEKNGTVACILPD